MIENPGLAVMNILITREMTSSDLIYRARWPVDIGIDTILI